MRLLDDRVVGFPVFLWREKLREIVTLRAFAGRFSTDSPRIQLGAHKIPTGLRSCGSAKQVGPTFRLGARPPVDALASPAPESVARSRRAEFGLLSGFEDHHLIVARLDSYCWDVLELEKSGGNTAHSGRLVVHSAVVTSTFPAVG
jgi:hypothetical protein